MTSLCFRIKIQTEEIISLLIFQVNDRNAKGQTALHIASEAGHAAVITALLSQGVDFEACDIEGIVSMH